MPPHAIERFWHRPCNAEWQASDYRTAGEDVRIGREHGCGHRAPSRQARNEHPMRICSVLGLNGSHHLSDRQGLALTASRILR